MLAGMNDAFVDLPAGDDRPTYRGRFHELRSGSQNCNEINHSEADRWQLEFRHRLGEQEWRGASAKACLRVRSEYQAGL